MCSGRYICQHTTKLYKREAHNANYDLDAMLKERVARDLREISGTAVAYIYAIEILLSYLSVPSG